MLIPNFVLSYWSQVQQMNRVTAGLCCNHVACLPPLPPSSSSSCSLTDPAWAFPPLPCSVFAAPQVATANAEAIAKAAGVPAAQVPQLAQAQATATAASQVGGQGAASGFGLGRLSDFMQRSAAVLDVRTPLQPCS